MELKTRLLRNPSETRPTIHDSPSAIGGPPFIWWGAAAAGLIGAVTAYVLEQQHRREEEEARQAAAAAAFNANQRAMDAAYDAQIAAAVAAKRAADALSAEQAAAAIEQADMTEAERLAAYQATDRYQQSLARMDAWYRQQAAMDAASLVDLTEQERWAARRQAMLEEDIQRVRDAHRRAEAAQPEPQGQKKSWWQQMGEWLNQNETGQRLRNAIVGFFSGVVAGAITGCIGGALVGSLVGGVGAGPGALGGAIIGGLTGGISGLVTGLLAQPSTSPRDVAIQAAIWGGVVGFLSGMGSAAVGIQGFAHGGQAWHIGLETTSHLNIIHIGSHPQYGFHIAFGGIAPYTADLHIYFERSFPFFRIWRP